MTSYSKDRTQDAWRIALLLSVATIVFSIIEGFVSTVFGARDESLALFGFGIDSFAEVASSSGVVLMILRLMNHLSTSKSLAEKRALQITSISFFLISGALLFAGLSSLRHGSTPTTTLPGIIVSLVSIAIMLILVCFKRRIGTTLSSDPIIADARCGEVCIYMSLVLLGSSLLYFLWGIRCADSIGAIALAVLSFKEGRGTWRSSQSSGNSSCCC